MITWIRPSGSKLTTNDRKETIAYCEANGWKREVKRKPKKKVETDGKGFASN